MKTRLISLLYVAGFILLNGCGQTTTPSLDTPGSEIGSSVSPSATAGHGTASFISSPILPKVDILPLYPGSIQGGMDHVSVTTSSFLLVSADTNEQFLAFYAQQLPQYGWRSYESRPHEELSYVWQSSDPGIEWDVVAVIQIVSREFPADGSTQKIISLYKDPKLDKLPVYPDAQIEENMDTRSGLVRTVQIVYRIDQSTAEVTKYYRENLPRLGWTEMDIQPGHFTNIINGPDSKSLSLSIAQLEGQGTRVTLQAQESP